MNTILKLTFIFGSLVMLSCGISKEEKEMKEAQQKAREDSLINATELATRQKIEREQAIRDSLNQVAKNDTQNEDPAKQAQNANQAMQNSSQATQEYIKAEENIRRQLEQMRKSMEQMQQLQMQQLKPLTPN